MLKNKPQPIEKLSRSKLCKSRKSRFCSDSETLSNKQLHFRILIDLNAGVLSRRTLQKTQGLRGSLWRQHKTRSNDFLKELWSEKPPFFCLASVVLLATFQRFFLEKMEASSRLGLKKKRAMRVRNPLKMCFISFLHKKCYNTRGCVLAMLAGVLVVRGAYKNHVAHLRGKVGIRERHLSWGEVQSCVTLRLSKSFNWRSFQFFFHKNSLEDQQIKQRKSIFSTKLVLY